MHIEYVYCAVIRLGCAVRAIPDAFVCSWLALFTRATARATAVLHPAVEEFGSGESLNERWLPTRSIESILVSVMSMLAEPNINSPANVTASVQYRDDTEGYNARVRDLCADSIARLPPGFVRPRFPKPASTPIALERQETQESLASDGNWYCDASDDENFEE